MKTAQSLRPPSSVVLSRSTAGVCAALLALYGASAAAAQDAALRLPGPKAVLAVDAKGISLTPSIAACPTMNAKGEPLWAVLLEKAGRPPIQGQPVVLTDQKQRVQRQTTPDGIRLTYDGLTDGKRTWRVSLTLDIRSQGDAFVVTGQLKNDEAGWTVCGFNGPVLDGIHADLATHPALLADGFGRRVNRAPQGKGKTAPWRPWGSRFEIASQYPGRLGTMQWCALAGAQGGFYLGCHDATHAAKTFALRYGPQDKRLGLVIKHHVFCAAGKSWPLPPTVLFPYEGTWHVAARHYRSWFDAATPLRQAPAWARDASGWLLCILKQQNGEVLWDYPSLKKLAEVADQRGLDILGLFGWAHGGHDHLYPDYHPDAKMGGEQALRAALKEIRRRGKRSILYANGQLQERDTEFWKTQGKDLAVIQRNGVSVQERWHKFRNAPFYQFDLGCTVSKGWYDRMLSLAVQANDLGADGILFDQLGVRGPMPCYGAGHGHDVPDMVYAGDRAIMLRRIADHMKTVNPDFIVMTEGLHDSVLDSVSLFHGCVLGMFSVSPPEILSRLHATSVSAAFPEMFRYTFPEVMSTIRLPTPMINRVIANYTCAYGLRYEIESRYAPDVRYLRENRVPEAAEYEQVISKPDVAMMQGTPPEEATRYLKTLIEFQRVNADLFWRGRYVDDQGFTFQGEDLIAKGFSSGDRVGVLVWNPTDQPATFTASVANGEMLSASEPEKGRVEAFAPMTPQAVRLLVWKKK